ncbi:hypothetical protein D9757_008325 [Collybiopsis confluens]|uniref:Uncharacterized protein n=1 Tax=Collybiopsis confluens TaxID=2823264 RepID=A0A8H5M5C1_9AGAR|nr:hypothetical protein D9757_008325 [Collybiopsis confluens]
MFFVNRSASSSSKDKTHSRRRPGSISRQSRDSPETLISSIINGNEYAQSFPQSSQYRAGGVSSCGLAALNCTRIVFETEENGQNSVLKTILTPDTTNNILTVSDMWSGSSHLEVDDLLQLPLFSRSLNLIETQYSEVSTKQLLHLLRQLEDRNGIAAAVITRPPEIILCLKIPVYQMGSAIPLNLFVIFDSHPRPSHPDGAGWLFTTSINDTSHHLYSILAVDRRILNDPSMQWEAQLLNHFSGHIIAPPDKRGQHGGAFYDPEVQEVIWNTSFRILGLQAELAEMKNRKEVLEGINKRYEDEQDAVRRDREEARRRIQELEETNDILLRQIQPVEPHPPRSDISSMSHAAALRRQRDRHGHDDDCSSSQVRVPDRSSSSWKGKQREMDPDPDSSKFSQRAGPINFFNWDNKQKPEMDPDPDSYKFSQRTGPLNFFNWENKQKPDDKLAEQPNSSPKAQQCEPGRESNPSRTPTRTQI